MKNFLSEDNIEKAVLQELSNQTLPWRTLNCFTAKSEALIDGSNRTDKSEVVFKDILENYLTKLNLEAPKEAILNAITNLTKGKRLMTLINANIEIYNFIRNGIQTHYKNSSGQEEPITIKIIDFNEPLNNDFLAVQQLWIKGELGYRRPDVILYINGLPLVLIELKNSNVSIKNAYTDNLTNYKKELPQLFWYNAITVLSNGKETKLGAYTAGWEHFGEWLRIKDEKEKPDRKNIAERGLSLQYAVNGVFEQNRLLDYIENFIMFHNSDYKICAKHHQFFGVNNSIESFRDRKNLDGKLGVYWHTQASGKSYSMVFFARKIFRKFQGNFTFLIITDRTDLNTQIYKDFLSKGVCSKTDTALPQDSSALRDVLKTNKRYIFTLIHKFRYDKGKQYPIISERDDIIVIVDEAHRTQYSTLADNMRIGLPNAQFIAFTATPLLGKERKTNAWFGKYISEFNYNQANEEKTTVPLYYDKRVPEVLIANEDLNEDLALILEEENLDEQQQLKLENKFSNEMEIIKRDDRLEIIAKDIAFHFPRRGYLGKGMIVCVDKFTTVKMYDKVNNHIKEQLKQLRKEQIKAESNKEKSEIRKIIDYLNNLEMAVVISEDARDKERFEAKGLNIQYHRDKLNNLDENQCTVEDNFKDVNHPLQLVFVCSKWIVGFNVPTLSTLYLDKPMGNHTLMQTITRANRVAPNINGVEKRNGLIVDYYNVIKNLKKTLVDYGGGDNPDGEIDPTDDLIKDKEELYVLLDETINTCIIFCKSQGIDLQNIVESNQTFSKLEQFDEYADVLLSNETIRKEFNVYDNTCFSLYEACRPDIIKLKEKYAIVEVMHYLRGVIDQHIGNANIEKAENRVSNLLDQSVLTCTEDSNGIVMESAPKYQIKGGKKELNLATLNFDKLREDFPKTKYKHIEIADLKAFLEQKLTLMIKQNTTRVSFIERFQAIIDKYNSGGTNTEDYYEDLINFTEDLKIEDKRSISFGLTEMELELFDLIQKNKLTKKEEQEVKNAAKHLLQRLKEEKPVVLIQDWFKDTQSTLKVKDAIESVLQNDLPKKYNRKDYSEVCNKVFDHVFIQASKGLDWVAA